MSNWRKLRALSWSDRRVLLQAAALLFHARLVLPFTDFRSDPGVGGEARSPLPAPATPGEVMQVQAIPVQAIPVTARLNEAQSIARLVGIAAAHLPVEVACLHRSLVLWRLLRRRGIRCELRLGAGAAGGPFEAHAWVECDGVPLNESAANLSRYRPFGQAVMPVLQYRRSN